jgi:hypothetical protein
VARDDGHVLLLLDTLIGCWKSSFFSRLHARIVPRLAAIGPLRNSNIQRGGRKTARRARLHRWHKPRTVIFGWEAPRACIDSTVSFSSITSRSRVAHSRCSVSQLLALPNGDLWIVFRTGGICLLRNGFATIYTARDGVPTGAIWGLAQDREGTIWAAAESGLSRLEGRRWKFVGKDWNFPGKSAAAIFLDHEGVLWVAAEDELVFLPPGARSFRPTRIQVGNVAQFTQAASGKLWLAQWMAEMSKSVVYESTVRQESGSQADGGNEKYQRPEHPHARPCRDLFF